MYRNIAGVVEFLAVDTATGLPKTGDAANITAYVSIDGGAVTALGDTSATELSSTNAKGVYRFDHTAAEANGKHLLFSGKSSTSGVEIEPIEIWTRTPPLAIGTAQAGASGSITLAAGESSVTDFHKQCLVKIIAGTGIGQARLMTAYNGTTKVATINRNWATNPDNTSIYEVWESESADPVNVEAAGIRTAVGLASANLDTQLSTIDDFLDTEVAAIKAKTDNLPADPADASDIATSFASIASTLSTIAGYLDTEVAAIKAKTDLIPASPAAVGSAMTLTAAGLDAVLVESGISASAALTDDAGSQLTGINARQAIAAILSACAAVLAGAATTNITMKKTGVPAGNTRIDATVDASGNRSAITLKVPT